MRKYSIGAVLLDKNNPSKVLGRSVQPLLSAADEDREGYVPNVVYTCGALKNGKQLFLPYGVADSSVTFAFVHIPDLLADLGSCSSGGRAGEAGVRAGGDPLDGRPFGPVLIGRLRSGFGPRF